MKCVPRLVITWEVVEVRHSIAHQPATAPNRDSLGITATSIFRPTDQCLRGRVDNIKGILGRHDYTSVAIQTSVVNIIPRIVELAFFRSSNYVLEVQVEEDELVRTHCDRILSTFFLSARRRIRRTVCRTTSLFRSSSRT